MAIKHRIISHVALLMLPMLLRAQMPTVRIDGSFGNGYSIGRMELTDGSGNTTRYDIKAKWRGNSAKTYEKKSYAIKTTDSKGNSSDVSLLGMRMDNNWILDAMAADKARMRNRVAFDLWNDFANPNFIKKEYNPDSFNGTHGAFVELYLNGEYQGIYCLTEKIDRKQLKLKKYKNGEVRGLLYKADNWNGTSFWNTSDDYDNRQTTWMGWESQYPDTEDEGETDWQPLYDAIRFVLESTDDEFSTEADMYFDLPVWNDYFLFIQVILAMDNSGKNTFTYIYDKTKDTRLGIAPWDLDATWGRNYDATETNYNALPDVHNVQNRLEKQAGYMERMAERYFQLRKTFFNSTAIKTRFSRYFEYFKANGADTRETERWSGKDGITLDFDEEKAYVSKWIDSRLAFLDSYYGQYTTKADNTVVSEDKREKSVYNLNGMRINKNTANKKGIYIIDGKKTVCMP